MKPRFYTLMFSIGVFLLTAVGLVIGYMGLPLLQRLWVFFLYLVGWILLLTLAYDFLIGEGKLSRNKVLLLAFSVMFVSATVTHSIKIVLTPSWSFSLSTDKSTYSLGEEVQITVSLENLGFITHSFKSSLSSPVFIQIENFSMGYSDTVWWSPPAPLDHWKTTEFTVSSHQFLEWNFVWNQTSREYPERGIQSGTYYIGAYVPSVTSWHPYHRPLFHAWAEINITSA